MTSSLFSKVSRTALAVVGIFAVTGCVGNGPSNIHPAVSSVPAGLELLSFNAPGLAPQSALRAEYKDNYQEEEYALFKGEGGAQAEVISVEASFYSGGAQGGDRLLGSVACIHDMHRMTCCIICAVARCTVWSWARRTGHSIPCLAQ